ncbi:hypothetical protein SNE40_020403 [Patella caerulea]|uniref:Uncharacterized protein n=1 Tax=Patella caerulea TaxID=87958 RepID=A0AAN8G4A0_PATCE
MCVVDPRIKLRWCRNESFKKSPWITTNNAVHHTRRLELDDFFGFITEDAASINKSNENEGLFEATMYSNGFRRCIANNPVLAKMACRYSSIPTSNAPVESMFRPDRCSMNDAIFYDVKK